MGGSKKGIEKMRLTAEQIINENNRRKINEACINIEKVNNSISQQEKDIKEIKKSINKMEKEIIAATFLMKRIVVLINKILKIHEENM